MLGELGREVLESLWLKGYANSRRLQFTRTGAAGIAWYTCKEAGASISYRSYNCSKNLKKPEERKRDGRVSAKKLAELRGDYCNAELFEKLYPGYEFVDADPYWDMYNIDGNGEAERIDFPYITIRMIKKDSAYIMRDKDRM